MSDGEDWASDSSVCSDRSDDDQKRILTTRQKHRARVEQAWEDKSDEGDDDSASDEAPMRKAEKRVRDENSAPPAKRGMAEAAPPAPLDVDVQAKDDDDDFLENFLSDEEDTVAQQRRAAEIAKEEAETARLQKLLESAGVAQEWKLGGATSSAEAAVKEATEAVTQKKGVTTWWDSIQKKAEEKQPGSATPPPDAGQELEDEFLKMYNRKNFGLEEEAEQAPRRDPDATALAEQYKAQGNDCVKRRDFAQAAALYTKGIEAGGEDQHVLYSNRSNAQLQLGHYKAAFADANAAIKEKPSWFKGYLRKALVFRAMGAKQEALDALNTALVHAQSDALAREDLKNQVEALEKATLQPVESEATGWYRILAKEADEGTKCFKAKDFTGAVTHFSRALQFDPTNTVLLANRSGAYCQLRQYGQALHDADWCLKLNPKYVKGYYRKAMALKGQMLVNEAIEVLTTGNKHDPTNSQVSQALAEMRKEQERKTQTDAKFRDSIFR